MSRVREGLRLERQGLEVLRTDRRCCCLRAAATAERISVFLSRSHHRCDVCVIALNRFCSHDDRHPASAHDVELEIHGLELTQRKEELEVAWKLPVKLAA